MFRTCLLLGPSPISIACALSLGMALNGFPQDGTYQELEAPDLGPNPEFDQTSFGWDVDIAGDLIVIGTPEWGLNGEFQPFGAAILYQRNNGGTPSNPADDTYDLLATLRVVPSLSDQGWTVATDGTSVYVGGLGPRIYEDTGGGVWEPVVDLPAPSPKYDAVLHNGTLVVGLSVWERSGGAWGQSQILHLGANVQSVSFSAPGRIGFDGNRIVYRGVALTGNGILITYIESNGNWVEEQNFSCSSSGSGQVSIHGDSIVAVSSQSEATVFEHDPVLGWIESQVLVASDNRKIDSVEIDDNRIYVGTRQTSLTHPHPLLRGVDIYERHASQWELSEMIPALLPLENVTAIAADSGTVVVGQEVLTHSQGGVSVFQVPFYATTTAQANVALPLTDGVTGEQPVEISFSNISSAGTTSLNITEDAPPLPSGFLLEGRYYDIVTTANFSGAVTVCIDYSGLEIVNETDLRLLHYEGGAWQDVTQDPVDTVNDIICGVANSLSPFAIVDASAAPDPLVMLADLVIDVAALNLANGIENSLDTKLERAIEALTDKAQQNDPGAINALESFISHTEAQSGNHIPASDADDLINVAEEIIGVLYVTIG